MVFRLCSEFLTGTKTLDIMQSILDAGLQKEEQEAAAPSLTMLSKFTHHGAVSRYECQSIGDRHPHCISAVRK